MCIRDRRRDRPLCHLMVRQQNLVGISKLRSVVVVGLPPVECSPGTTPSQAENPRPFLKAAPLPIAATVAVAVIGPIPGIATRRLHCSSSPQMRPISLSVSPICPVNDMFGSHVMSCRRAALELHLDSPRAPRGQCAPLGRSSSGEPEQTAFDRGELPIR